ncbi:MAG: DegT/DnrJ/EryC1/StrS family aminotransferase [Elusimicrobia bacterium]|nr:DegT/DnrJ/EryC1/StrS family aminotransferase [Elusimicrobiota bacterium]
MIPVNEPKLDGKELEYVTRCVRDGWISSAGSFLDEFEERWAAYCGRRHGVAVSSGTAALQLAVACLGLEPGDEVILPSFTIISCASAVVFNGGVPVLADADPRTWCLDPAEVERKITPRTRAVMPVHIYGHPADMDPLLELARKRGLAVIEDAAEAHGAEYLTGRSAPDPAWRRCGSFGTMSAFSFYANKLVTTGEGGMLLTDDERLAGKARSLRNLAFRPDRRFRHEELGFNFRLTNLQAAIGLAQVERMDAIVSRKRFIGQGYRKGLQGAKGLELHVEEPWARSVDWMVGVVLSEETGMDARLFAERLAERGVETRPFFLGMHEQPALLRRGLFEGQRYPVTERLSRQGLYLPSGLALTDGQLEQVCAAVRGLL